MLIITIPAMIESWQFDNLGSYLDEDGYPVFQPCRIFSKRVKSDVVEFLARSKDWRTSAGIRSEVIGDSWLLVLSEDDVETFETMIGDVEFRIET